MDIMNDSADKEINGLARLKKALIDDILDASDESILAEARQDGHDPVALAAATRALFEKAALASNKALLAAAKAAVAADRRRTATVVPLDPAAARQRLARLVAQQPEAAMTMAARKGKPADLSDEEVFGLLEDFEELGISLREEPDGKP
jgi:hypothetical protein